MTIKDSVESKLTFDRTKFDVKYRSGNFFQNLGDKLIYDDIDLAFGRLRLKQGSSDGGHNGIKSIDRYISRDQYWKLKIGVGRPPNGVDPADYVLSKFNNDEREEVEFIVEDAIDVIEEFSKDREAAVKKASERRIIDVI